MNNKMITLGTITLDWHFAKGKFSCNCSTTEDINAFDRVICGIIYRSNDQLSKDKIATLMGFNVIDNPMINRYADRSECAIFKDAVSSLVSYGLVHEYGDELFLTAKGRIAFETGTKQKDSLKEVELWCDEYSNNESTKDLFHDFAVEKYIPTDGDKWNILSTSPLSILQLQEKDIVKDSERRTVTKMTPLGMDYYVAHVNCKICLDLISNRCIVSAESNSGIVNDVLSGDAILQSEIKKTFFSSQMPSVIYKQKHQEWIEKLIVDQDSVEGEDSCLVMPENDFYNRINSIVEADDAKIIYCSINTLTNQRIEQICKLTNKIVCVEFLDGDYEQEMFVMNGVCFRKVNQLRTQDLCVYDSIYYSQQPFIVDNDNVSYNIPLLYRLDDKKYNLNALYIPFSSYILNRCIEIGQIYSQLLQQNSSSSIVDNFIKYCRKIESLTLDLTGQENTISEFKTLVDQIIDIWKNQIHERLNSLEYDIVNGQTLEITMALLREIEEDVESSFSDDELYDHIDKIKDRLRPAKLNIRRRSIYIIDTCVFMNMPDILNRFNLTYDKVVVPRVIQSELDDKAHYDKEAKKACLYLRRKKDDYPHFVSIKEESKLDLLPNGWDTSKKNDNHMIATAMELSESDNYDKVVIVSDDKIFVDSVHDLISKSFVSDKIEAIDRDELLMRLND